MRPQHKGLLKTAVSENMEDLSLKSFLEGLVSRLNILEHLQEKYERFKQRNIRRKLLIQSCAMLFLMTIVTLDRPWVSVPH